MNRRAFLGGAGKTLAFYLPVAVEIAEDLDETHWTKCVSIYPRTELLKDQMSDVLSILHQLDERAGESARVYERDTPSPTSHPGNTVDQLARQLEQDLQPDRRGEVPGW